MTTTTGFWVRVPRDVVTLAGPDAQTYLHSQVSQDVRPLEVVPLRCGVGRSAGAECSRPLVAQVLA